MDDNRIIEESTEGFYKLDGESWLFAPNFVSSPTFELYKELKDTYSYPIEGWNWYDQQPEGFTQENTEQIEI